MKKLFIYGLMSLTLVAFSGQPAMAFFLHWLRDKCHGSKYTMTVCMRQYNAFTPICSGMISCDGCAPLNMTFGGFMPSHPPVPPWFCPPMHCPPSCHTTGCDAGCLPTPGHAHAAPGQPSSGGNLPNFTPPPPTPLAMNYQQMHPAMWQAMMYQQMMQRPVQPVGYQYGYYPGYNYPMQGYPMQNYYGYNYPNYGYPNYNPWMAAGYNYYGNQRR